MVQLVQANFISEAEALMAAYSTSFLDDIWFGCCRGKTTAQYTPSMDMGAFVIVVNAEKVIVTGDKANQKMYRRHTGRPGSMKEETFKHLQGVWSS